MPDPLDRLNASLGERYVIEKEVGSGGMATVFLAEDVKHRRRVAIKVLRPELAAAMGSERFLAEIGTTAKLVHPHIVPLFDSGHADGVLYYVMPFVEGESLRDLLRRERQLSVDQALRITGQVADALDYAHRHDVIHRDIKPENILLHDGQALVADFGIALAVAQAGGERLTQTGVSLGTPSYMSPEQAAGDQSLDGRSDLYSLACVLYEMLAGDPPFVASTALAILARHIADAAPPISTVRPGVGRELAGVLERALEKVPADRFPTLAAFSEKLAACGDPRPSDPVPTVVAGVPLSFRVREHTVGRELVSDTLRSELERVSDARGGVVCVTGEAGIGKTTVVENFLAELAVPPGRYRLGRGRCSERMAGSEAYLPILEALESLVGLEPSLGSVLREMSPGWAAQIESAGHSPSVGPTGITSQERLKRELASFLRQASLKRPVVLLLEDLHWADVSTVDLLAYVADRLDTTRVLVLGTYRSEEMREVDHPFLGLKSNLEARGVLREITLEFLSEGDVVRYLGLEFPGGSLDPGLARLVHRRTEGSPLFMVDLVRYLRDQGVIKRDGQGWSIDRPFSALDSELPQSVRSMIQRKVDRLSGRDRTLLALASVQGYEFQSAVLAEVLGADPADVEEHLQTLERVHEFVARVAEEDLPDGTFTVRYQFVHVLYQNALYEDLPATRRIEWSRAVAEVIAAHHADHVGGIAGELAHLFEVGRDPEKAVTFYLLAAKGAAEVFANHEVVRFADRGLAALKRLPQGPDRYRLELDLEMARGPALLITRGYASPEVERTYARAQELTGKVGDAAQLLSVLVGLFYYRGLHDDLGSAKEIAIRIMDLIEDRLDPGSYLPAGHQLMASVLAWTGDLPGALEHGRLGLELYDHEAHAHLLHIVPQDPKEGCLAFTGYSLWFQGFLDQASARMGEALAWAREFNHGNSIAEALSFAGTMAAEMHRVEEAIQLGEELRLRGLDDGIPDRVYLASMIEGRIEILRGNLNRGLGLLGQDPPFALLTSVFGAWEAHGYLMAGERAKCMAVADRSLSLIPRTGDHQYEPENHRLRGEALAAAARAGDPSFGPEPEGRAEEAFGESLRIAREQGAHLWELRAAASLSRLWHGQGRCDEARRLLAEVYGWFTEGFGFHDLKEAKALLEEWG
jgi:tRNA A-37 threonylcarbamoyl transferase component Bud32/predicted ATPase